MAIWFWRASVHLNRYFFGPIGWTGIIGVTVLGWITVSQIRRSAGKLYGLWLAVFDGLFFPLLVVDGAIAWLWLVLAKLFARQVLGLQDSLFLDIWDLTIWVSLALASVVWVDWLIIRRVWSTVNKPFDGSPPNPLAKDSSGQISTQLPLFIASMSGVLGAVAFCLFPNPPVILVWSILVVALFGIVLGIPARRNWVGKSAIVVGSINTAIWLAVGLAVQFVNSPPPVSTQIYYAAFQMDAGLVDRLIPVSTRENGVMQGIKPDMAESQVTAASTNGVFTWTDSQCAEISPETQTRLRNEMEANGAKGGGLLAESSPSPSVEHWPVGAPLFWGYANGINGHEVGGGRGVLGIEHTGRGLQIRIECNLDHRANDLRDGLVQSKILYEGPLPQTNALAFLVPFEKKDGSAHYLVVVFEISAPPPIGLVIERYLPFEQYTAGPHYINFRTGKIISPSPDLPVTRGGNDFENWASQNGADALADELASGPKLASYVLGCKFIAVGAEQWNKISTAELDKEFAGTNLDQAAATRDPKSFPATFLFKTRDGTAGVLQILGETDNPRSVKIRYKLVQNGVTTATPVNLPPVAAQNLSFGPVMERVIEFTNPNRRALNLASGNYLTFAAGKATNFGPDAATTLRAKGADLYFSGDNLTTHCLAALDWRMQNAEHLAAGSGETHTVETISPVMMQSELDYWNNESWKNNTNVSQAMAGLLSGVKADDLKNHEQDICDNDVIMFITRDGTKGVLQIAGYTGSPNKPDGVKIHYKLVQNSGD
jgi:hypothetical protein